MMRHCCCWQSTKVEQAYSKFQMGASLKTGVRRQNDRSATAQADRIFFVSSVFCLLSSVFPRDSLNRIFARGALCRKAIGASAANNSPYLSSASRGTEAGTEGRTNVTGPLRTYARWKGAKRGASNPSLISRVTANRLNALGGRYKRRFD